MAFTFGMIHADAVTSIRVEYARLHAFGGSMRLGQSISIGLAALVGLSLASETLAKPPPWAPAHGYRAKNTPFYVGYTGHQWGHDYGIIGGRCDTDEILAVAGAVTGGIIGGKVASPEQRVVGVLVGAVLGGVIGAQIGDRLDKRDRACIGHSLELARTGQRVRWTNPTTGLSYQLRPVSDLADGCRQFEFVRRDGGRSKPAELRACSRDSGSWSFGRTHNG
jgi:surface antigen